MQANLTTEKERNNIEPGRDGRPAREKHTMEALMANKATDGITVERGSSRSVIVQSDEPNITVYGYIENAWTFRYKVKQYGQPRAKNTARIFVMLRLAKDEMDQMTKEEGGDR